MHKTIFVISGILACLFASHIFAAQKNEKPLPCEVQNYINKVSERYHFKKSYLRHLFAQAQYNPMVVHSITKPFETKHWDFYRRHFIKAERIQAGVDYWKTHRASLEEIAKKYGVNPSIIVAIIGVETMYGTKAGEYPEMDALYTLSFYYPPREKFFRKELTQFLLLTRKTKMNPLKIKGSYAGALGIPQFMPSSYLHYGVKFDPKDELDLFNNHPDAIASIANYLQKSGWKYNAPIATLAKFKNGVPTNIISASAKPQQTLATLEKNGVEISDKIKPKIKASLIEMNNERSKEYWIVFPNFYAIMRYNPRTTYSLAVYQLSQAIREQYEREVSASRQAVSRRKA